VEQQGGRVHKTFKGKLKPSPQQERGLECVLTLCHHVYNAAVGCGVVVYTGLSVRWR
jgi:hypothetical protein